MLLGFGMRAQTGTGRCGLPFTTRKEKGTFQGFRSLISLSRVALTGQTRWLVGGRGASLWGSPCAVKERRRRLVVFRLLVDARAAKAAEENAPIN